MRSLQFLRATETLCQAYAYALTPPQGGAGHPSTWWAATVGATPGIWRILAGHSGAAPPSTSRSTSDWLRNTERPVAPLTWGAGAAPV